MADLVRQYADFPLGTADASVIAVAERAFRRRTRRSRALSAQRFLLLSRLRDDRGSLCTRGRTQRSTIFAAAVGVPRFLLLSQQLADGGLLCTRGCI
jgi:hypothetical protein